jgi:maltooligosyltrehalose trehalohydrolase
MLAGDAYAYYADYEGNAMELAATLQRGWLFVGQHSRCEDAPRGTDPSHVAMRKSIVCIQNHDQIGNRALGDRLTHRADPAAWRAASAVLLLAPMTPLLFMGQEWAASSPFQFFTDFAPELGEKVVAGRRREFQAFPEFATPEAADKIPNPQQAATFEASKLNWNEVNHRDHARALALYRALIALRLELDAPASDQTTCPARAADPDTVVFERTDGDGAVTVIGRLRGGGEVAVPEIKDAEWEMVLSTEVDPCPARIDPEGHVTFERPGAVVLRRQGART